MPVSAKIQLTAMQGAEKVVTRCFDITDDIELYLNDLEERGIRATVIDISRYSDNCCNRKRKRTSV